MRAMILAAGRGERMRPLTDVLPKSLLMAGGKPLIVWHVEKFAAAGFEQIVINHAYRGALIEKALGDGERFGVKLVYSREAEALETAGGIATALPLLGDVPFAVVNADVFSDYDYAHLAAAAAGLERQKLLAHLVLVANPAHHVDGDFGLRGDHVVLDGARLTFSGMAAYHPAMFNTVPHGAKAKLAPLLREQIGARRVSGEQYGGLWRDIGTPERLAELDRKLGLR